MNTSHGQPADLQVGLWKPLQCPQYAHRHERFLASVDEIILRLVLEDVAEDERRLHEFLRTRKAIPFEDVKAWTESWGTEAELPRPSGRGIE